MDEEAKEHQELLDACEEERNQVEADWQDITDYLLPMRGMYLTKAEEPNKVVLTRFKKIIDPTGTFVAVRATSGIQGGLASASRPWFQLTLEDKELAEYSPVKVWLDYVEKAMYSVYARSNFYPEANLTYLDLLGFGTSAIVCMEDPETVCRFNTLAPGEYHLMLNERKQIDTLLRRYWMEARSIVAQFGGGNVSDDIKQASEGNEIKWFEICHCIRPNTKRDTGRVDGANKAYESFYWEYGRDQKLRKSGFDEKPFAAPRWLANGSDAYGIGPGHMVLGHVKMLQEENKGLVHAIHKANEPPLQAPIGFKGRLMTFPNAVNYVGGSDKGEVKPLYTVKPEIAQLRDEIQDRRDQIKEGLFYDLFLMIANADKEMTATEVSERIQEKQLLGPFIERQEHELLTPIHERVFSILMRQPYMIPRPPKEIQGASVKVEYVSTLAQAQKRIGTQNLTAFIQFAGGMHELKPDAIDKVDFDQAIDEMADMIGVPAKVVVPDNEVEKKRVQRAKQKAKELQVQQQIMAAQQAKTLSEADMEGKNALTESVG